MGWGEIMKKNDKLQPFFFCYSFSYLKTVYVFSQIVLYFYLTIYFLFSSDSQIDVCARYLLVRPQVHDWAFS